MTEKTPIKKNAAATETNGTPGKKEPSANEAMFFFAMVKHTRNKADVDWDLVAKDLGLKSGEVAKVRFGQIKRKLGISSVVETPPAAKRTAGTSAKSTPAKTPTKAVEDEEADDVEATPVKEEKKSGTKNPSTPRKTAKKANAPAKVAKTTGRVGDKGRAGPKTADPFKDEEVKYEPMKVDGFDDNLSYAEAYEAPSQFEEAMTIKDMFRDDEI
ncbi:hypothetical protein CP533_6371 [Ophiocordyceps camponoti-saundersi (nom. inval.)]|nr:hypothetical protein CP533_6371 [Ophiocordyceps camponoti-saundersi (nom. inval.)]